jgi:hypothetical protein
LLAHEAELLTDSDIEEDLGEIRALLRTPNHTEVQRNSLAARLRLALRDIQDLAQATGQPPSKSPETERAIRDVAELVTE